MFKFSMVTPKKTYKTEQALFQSALNKASSIIDRAEGHALRLSVTLDVQSSAGFWAMIQPDREGFLLKINTGTVDTLHNAVLKTGIVKHAQVVDTAAEDALIWLMLHELIHIALGHFNYLDSAEIVGLSTKKQNDTVLNELAVKLDIADVILLRQCFEMQADWEATDYFLADHSAKDYGALRRKLSAVLLVICLIERTNLAAGTYGIDHPPASARFFAMLAGVFQRFLYEGAELEHDGDTSKIIANQTINDAAILAYKDLLVKPLVGDAVAIASSLDLTQFLKDIFDLKTGEAALFQDIADAQFADNIQPELFKTDGARKWCELLLINERIVRETGLRQ